MPRYFPSDSIRTHSEYIPRLYHRLIFRTNMRGSFRIEVPRRRDRGNIEGSVDLSRKGRGGQKDGAKVDAFVLRRVLHLYGVRESFVERLMRPAKRRDKIKTKRRARRSTEAEGGAGQGINPEINQSRESAVRRSSSRRYSLRYRAPHGDYLH